MPKAFRLQPSTPREHTHEGLFLEPLHPLFFQTSAFLDDKLLLNFGAHLVKGFEMRRVFLLQQQQKELLEPEGDW